MRVFRELGPGEDDGSAIAQQTARIGGNLGSVRSVVGFASARGGVGKSALLANVAVSLALAGRKVGIVDGDLNSPSISTMLGMKTGRRAFTSVELEPGAGPLGLRIVSSEFLPEGEPPPVSFVDFDEPPSAPQNGAHPNEIGYFATMRRMLGSTRFGPLDLLLVDLGPGLEQIYRLLKIVPGAGVVLVSHPSDLAAKTIKPAVGLVARSMGHIIGVIENMAGFNCDGCHAARPLLPYGAVATVTREAGAALLDRLPFDPRLAEACDRGTSFVREYPDTPLAKQLVALAANIGKLALAHSQPEASPGA